MTESFRTQDGRALTYGREGSGPVLGPTVGNGYLLDSGGDDRYDATDIIDDDATTEPASPGAARVRQGYVGRRPDPQAGSTP